MAHFKILFQKLVGENKNTTKHVRITDNLAKIQTEYHYSSLVYQHN